VLIGYDAELQRHTAVFQHACAIQLRDHVLDIGCGTGQTTRDAARMAPAGTALGVDISAQMIDHARNLAREEGVRNVAFDQGDAQIYRFPNNQFDVAISRFGTMFFDDPGAAFANIGQALRAEGRLVMMVWQARERNAWSVSIERAIEGQGAVRPQALAPDPFSLADRTTTEAILSGAGFGQVTFTDIREPVFYGPNVQAALDWVCGFTSTRQVLDSLDAAQAERALQRLRDTLAEHLSERGVWFDSRAWIVEALRK
jgi:SAM-dependent methyltransferase